MNLNAIPFLETATPGFATGFAVIFVVLVWFVTIITQVETAGVIRTLVYSALMVGLFVGGRYLSATYGPEYWLWVDGAVVVLGIPMMRIVFGTDFSRCVGAWLILLVAFYALYFLSDILVDLIYGVNPNLEWQDIR